MSFQFNYHQSLEQNIRRCLTTIREENPDNYGVPMLLLYSWMANAVSDVQFGIYNNKGGLTAAVFNKAVGDLKKVGIVRTAKTSAHVYLSDDAWAMHLERKKLAVTPKVVQS